MTCPPEDRRPERARGPENGAGHAPAPALLQTVLRHLTVLLGLHEYRCPVCGMPVDPCGGGTGPASGAWAMEAGSAAAPAILAGLRAHGLCPDCARALAPRPEARCRACGLPLPLTGQGLICGDCLLRPPPWQGLALYGRYSGHLRRLILRFKHGGRPALAFLLAGLLAEAAVCLPLPDAVVAIPQHPARLRRRGYNQAHELAVQLGLLLRLPVRPALLCRTAPVPQQTGLPAARRQANAEGSFRAGEVRDLHLWLVDDIITTGSTVRAAARELLRNGARRVDVLALARTPRP